MVYATGEKYDGFWTAGKQATKADVDAAAEE